MVNLPNSNKAALKFCTMENNQKQEDGFKITNWEESSKKLKEQFNQLTDADLKFENGKENDLLHRIENRLNKKRPEVIDLINKHQKQSKL